MPDKDWFAIVHEELGQADGHIQMQVLSGVLRYRVKKDAYYYEPYDCAVAFTFDGHTAILQALATDKLTNSIAMTAIRWLKKNLAKKVRWERYDEYGKLIRVYEV